MMVIKMNNTRLFYSGDNILHLSDLNDNLVQLVYLDPPFNAKRNFYFLGSKKVFNDTWHNNKKNFVSGYEDILDFINNKISPSMCNYINALIPVILESKRILKSNGQIWLHCDSTSCHYLKIIMDDIFGINNYRNNIVLKRYAKHNDAKYHYGHYYDNILLYSASEIFKFNRPFEEHSETALKQYRFVDDNGRYSLQQLSNTSYSESSNLKFTWRGYTPPVNKAWMYNANTLEEMYRIGKVIFNKNGIPMQKLYLEDTKGSLIQDLWDDLGRIKQSEYVAYPTQKRLLVMERILRCATDKNDIILDPFAGSGTTLLAAEKMERGWIGMDNSEISLNIFTKRLEHMFPDVSFDVIS